MKAFYNEWSAYPAAWLRNLIAADHIADGVVDERSIAELRPVDLVGRTQFHAFAGIGIWSAGLRVAGWPDSRAAWTASLPCQPFSLAGERRGFDDERHLWPVYFELVRECRPDVILGEQVSSPDGRAWFDAVSADLEGAGYAVGALNTCAAGVGAHHIRQRLYWCAVDRMGHTNRDRTGRDGGWSSRAEAPSSRERGEHGRIGNEPGASGPDGIDRRYPWAEVEWLACSDGKSRPAQPGIRPLAPRTTGGVEQLRAYGNGLCLEQAATFIEAVMDVLEGAA